MIYLLRHGEIETPAGRRFIGQIDYPLSEKGRAQAEYWKTALADKGLETVFCSDLARSKETAEIISGDLMADVRVLTELREIGLGDWDGCLMQEIRERFSKSWEKRGRSIDTFRTPGGESFSDLYQRVVPAFHRICRSAQGNVLVVGHAGVNRMILCSVLGMQIDKLFSIQQNHGALNIIENKQTGLQVVSMNLTPVIGNGSAGEN